MLRKRSTFVVAVPPRSRTVMCRCRRTGCVMCHADHVGRAGEAVEQPGARQQALHLDEVVALRARRAELVEAAAALDAVLAVGHGAAEPIVAVAQVDDVVALAAGDDVLARTAEHPFGGVRAVEDVLVGPAVEGERDPRPDGVVRGDEVDVPAPRTVRRSSPATAFWLRITGSRPSMRTSSMNGRTPMLSNPSVPWMAIWSRAPSRKPRSAVGSRTAAVAERSPTSTRSCPPAAVTSSASTAVLSVVDGRVSSETRALVPFACSVNSSDSPLPIARSVSLPAWPSIWSKPSPWSTVSSPLPSRTTSSPPPGWTKSTSSPLAIVSAPAPPITVSGAPRTRSSWPR